MLAPPQMENGQGLVEYALILILVAMIVLVIMAVFGQAVGNMFSNVVSGI
jgi:pilus assembly protein Flp/PilA